MKKDICKNNLGFGTYVMEKNIKNENKYAVLLSNTAIFAVGNILSKIILSLLLPLYTHELSAAEYGTAELVTTISQLIIPICSISIQDGVFRYAMDTKNNRLEVLKCANVIMLFAVLLMLGVSIALNGYGAISDWIVPFFLISVFTMYRSVLSLYVKATKHTVIFSIDSVCYNFVLAVCNILFLAVFSWKLSGYFAAMIVANVISGIYLTWNSKELLKLKKISLNKPLLKEMIRYSAPLVLNSISWGMTHVVDRVMLTEFCGAALSGVYSAASKIPSLLSLVTGVFTQAWTLSMIKDYETEKDTKFYSNIFLVTHIGVIGTALLILLLNNSLFPFVLGTEFEDAVTFVPVLLLGAVFLTYSNYYSSIYAATKNSKKIMYSSLGGGILNIVLNMILIPKFGIMGACIATAVSYVYIGVYRMLDCQKICSLKIEFGKFIVSIVALVIVVYCVTSKHYAMFTGVSSIIIIGVIYRRNFVHIVKSLMRFEGKDK